MLVAITVPEHVTTVRMSCDGLSALLTAEACASVENSRAALEIGTKIIAELGPHIATRCGIADQRAAKVRGEIRERLRHLFAWLDEVPQ